MSFNDSDLFFQPDPQEISENFEWKILRPKEGRRLAVTCISSAKFGTLTHFTPQGTLPHLKGECSWCKSKRDLRWHGYFEAVLHPTLRRVIVEMTPRASQMLTQGIEKFKTMRGLDIILEREGDRPNSPQTLLVKRITPLPGDLPAEVPILPILKRIWQIASPGLNELLDQTAAAVQGTVSELELLERHMDGPDSEWMVQRATDLAGQLKLPLKNGRKK
jgi:hypothetical protein